MDRKKVLYIALMAVLVALLLFGQWYKRPLDMETITGVTDRMTSPSVSSTATSSSGT